MMKRILTRLTRVVPIGACALLFAANANAFDMHAHAEAGAAHFLGVGGAWQAHEIGTGAVGSGSLELPLPYRFGLELRFVAGRFADGQAPLDPSMRRTQNAALYGLSAGLRWQPLWDDRGLWFATSFGKTETGDLVRNVFDARVGWDFRLGGAFSGGPFVGYMQVIQPNDNLRPEDGRIAMFGLHLAIDNIPGLTGAGAGPQPIERNDVAPAPKPAPAPKSAPKPMVAVAPPPPAPEVAPVSYEAPPTATVTENEIVISDHVYFDLNSPNLTKGSQAVLQSVALTMIAHPEIEVLEIDGHTDDLGSDEWNQKLSVSRANAVRSALIGLGVPAARLTVQGFGKSKPLVWGADEDSRQRNRRVEFVIQRRTAQ
jgi:outer membrane protein OmpA-like peptidoglycan-associated protein